MAAKKDTATLHPAFNYISVWELSNLANGTSIANYVYTCIGGLDGIDHGLDDDPHLDIQTGIFDAASVHRRLLI